MIRLSKYSINLYVLYNDLNNKIVKSLLYKERFSIDDRYINLTNDYLSRRIVFNNKLVNYVSCFQIKEEIVQLINDSDKYDEKMVKQISNEIDPIPSYPIIIKELVIFLKRKKIKIEKVIGYEYNIKGYFESDYFENQEIFHRKKSEKEIINGFIKITNKEVIKTKNNTMIKCGEKLLNCNKNTGFF